MTDIFDVELLQQLQDAFCTATGISVGVCDQNGASVTENATCTAFCNDFNKENPVGLSRCNECDKKGMELAAQRGGAVTYTCHAGLVDFAAPIKVEDRILGYFLGGQVLEQPLDEEAVTEYAEEIGVDPDAYLDAARQLNVLNRKSIETAATYLHTIGDIMSHMAYKKYHIMLENFEIEREAHMKSDFLANMSHEIRTPMNAVIGMVEMALREELPPAAREYINQIKTAGNSLLTIINDILDFSKIESGKMDINLCEYEPADIINDIANIIMTRIGTKNMDLIVDFAPDIPYQLMGDNIRIKQVIINLANNAVKFTKEGMVKITVGFTKKSEREILLQVSVQDTGMGIKKEDMNKLFQSFQQLDSKRNRNIEGSGLGLAISKQLVSLMNGNIHVESEYEVGSTFSFELPQLVLNDKPSVGIDGDQPITAVVLCNNQYISTSLKKDIHQFGAECIPLSNVEELQHYAQSVQIDFLFIDHPIFSDPVREFVIQNPDITAVLMIDFRTSLEYNISNLLIVKKPLYSLNIAAIFNHEDVHKNFDQTDNENFDYIAPDAKVLIVDDNKVNLTVAQGLMEPLQMKIDTVLSGKEAIEKITVTHYDLIFMDHMMPELDGIETTHIIRRFHEDYNDVPIIALTANAMEEMRSMFLVEGMNDFIAKPLEMRVLVAKLRQWLPKEKVKSYQHNLNHNTFSEETLPQIRGLDTELALKYLGSSALFWDVLRDFYLVITKKADVIEKYAQEQDWKNYTVEVHALKSAARQIGAISLSEKAAALEQAGKEEDIHFITSNTPSLLDEYRYLNESLSPYCHKEQKEAKDKVSVSQETLLTVFDRMKVALEELDMDGMDDVVNELDNYQLDAEQEQIFEQLRNSVEEMDVDTCATLIDGWAKKLKG